MVIQFGSWLSESWTVKCQSLFKLEVNSSTKSHQEILCRYPKTLTYSPLRAGNLSSKSSTDSWLDSVLGQSKQGVFSADFEDDNNTWVELGDGENMTLDCRVFLKQEKTVRQEILSDVILKLSVQ